MNLFGLFVMLFHLYTQNTQINHHAVFQAYKKHSTVHPNIWTA